MSFVGFLIIGAIAGWLAGKISRGYGFGLIGNLLIGIGGAFIGGFILDFLGFRSYGTLAKLGTSTFGAVVLLFVLGKFKK